MRLRRIGEIEGMMLRRNLRRLRLKLKLAERNAKMNGTSPQSALKSTSKSKSLNPTPSKLGRKKFYEAARRGPGRPPSSTGTAPAAAASTSSAGGSGSLTSSTATTSNGNCGGTVGEEERRAHFNKHGKSRQPLLEGITSQYDLDLFLLAQQRAAEATLQGSEVNENVQESSIKTIELGRYEVSTWYNSPYPEEYARLPKIYICEFCLKYMKSSVIMRRHATKCPWKYPPGDEIYRRDDISIWEVDGLKNKIYCQNLCLLAKLFLDHKTLYFDVEPFLFYVMTTGDKYGCHIIGYFSKEKNSFLNYNVSCILTLPIYMRKGYGSMLIDFSYLLSRLEGITGSPEKPLSDLGLFSYRNYWKGKLLEFLHKYEGCEVSIKGITVETGINPYDIVSTLQAMGMLKYWKGKHLVLKREDLIDQHIQKNSQLPAWKKDRIIDPSALKWKPLTSKDHKI